MQDKKERTFLFESFFEFDKQNWEGDNGENLSLQNLQKNKGVGEVSSVSIYNGVRNNKTFFFFFFSVSEENVVESN